MALTLLLAWRAARDRLIAAGIDSPVLDARMLLGQAAGVTREVMLTDPYRELSAAQQDALEALLLRREAREPISHILGIKPFWTLEFSVGPDVLTPRPETEFLIQAALEGLPKDAAGEMLDLGTGSGAIVLTLLHERPGLSGIGLDCSASALRRAAANAEALGLTQRCQWLQGDWRDAPDGQFRLIVANPPYIPSGEIDGLDPEVARFEPRLALDGGDDGLEAYRAIAPLLARRLADAGQVLLEVGAGQAPAVQMLLVEAGLEICDVRKDLGGQARVVIAKK